MGNQVQLNAWIDGRYAYFGMNIERVDSFRVILPRLDWREFETCLKKLRRYRLMLTKDPVPGRKGAEDVVAMGATPCSNVNVSQLRKKIERVLYDESRPRRWRPHLTTFAQIWDNRKLLSKPAYLEIIQREKEHLVELLRLLTI